MMPWMLGAVIGMSAYSLYQAHREEARRRELVKRFDVNHHLPPAKSVKATAQRAARSVNTVGRDSWHVDSCFPGCPRRTA